MNFKLVTLFSKLKRLRNTGSGSTGPGNIELSFVSFLQEEDDEMGGISLAEESRLIR